ncbi:hypothetical protein ACSBR1_043718 [Camellia fascicularis]
MCCNVIDSTPPPSGEGYYSCGANDFSFLMKKKLDETGTSCSYKNYDVLQAKGELKLVGSLQPASQCCKEHRQIHRYLDFFCGEL